ncbi:unnamed protein product [Trichobilharzia regenti]|nr:unnamed protein product [Trichobilharzia regenti]
MESIRSVLNDFEPDELSAISIAKCLCLFLRTADGQLNTPSRSNSLSSQANSWKIDPTICDTNNRQSGKRGLFVCLFFSFACYFFKCECEI